MQLRRQPLPVPEPGEFEILSLRGRGTQRQLGVRRDQYTAPLLIAFLAALGYLVSPLLTKLSKS